MNSRWLAPALLAAGILLAAGGAAFSAALASVAALPAAAAAGVLFWREASRLRDRVHWLEQSLDAVPNPITVTDLDMRWVFVNKTTETLLGRGRDAVRGHHCSEWKADICGTDKCGVACLRSGKPRTNYMQKMPDGTEHRMQVDTSYVCDAAGRRIGHIEMVTDVDAQHKLENVYSTIASSLEEMSSAIVEIEAQTKGNAAHAAEASRLASESSRDLSTGNQQVRDLVASIAQINESSQRISKINKAIDEIAFQTNILALNAAVEAARAGESGAGFAVVADEVRSLAARAADAARETSGIIGEAVSSARTGAKLAGEVAEHLGSIESVASRINDLSAQIARASQEQAQGISAVSEGLQRVEQLTLSSAGNAMSSTALRVLS